jgi:hypothetical protein
LHAGHSDTIEHHGTGLNPFLLVSDFFPHRRLKLVQRQKIYLTKFFALETAIEVHIFNLANGAKYQRNKIYNKLDKFN